MDDNSKWDGWLALSDQVSTLDPELIHPGLFQSLHSHGHVGADLCVARLKGLLVLPLLLNEVADDGAATVITRWLPGECDGVLGALSVMEFLRV